MAVERRYTCSADGRHEEAPSLKIFTVFRRGFAHIRLKIMVEIGQIVIAAFKTDLGNLFVGFTGL